MATSIVVAVRDSAMLAFGRPLFVPSIGVAMRSFQDEVNRAEPDNQMYLHPDDFELWLLAQFDETTGEFLPVSAHLGGVAKCLARAKDVVIVKE